MTAEPNLEEVPIGRWKRAVDLCCALLLLGLLGPPALVAGLAVFLAMGRPVLFYQRRSGLRGRPFRVAKLRTMIVDRTHNPTERVPLSHPHITPLGRILRRFKLDEVPQLLSVLKGDMSLIGPRPALPEQTREYDEFSKQRLRVRPGLTGLAQINGGSSLPWPERVKYDVYYVRNAGLLLDLKIILKTIPVVLLGERRYLRLYEDSPHNGPSPITPSTAEGI